MAAATFAGRWGFTEVGNTAVLRIQQRKVEAQVPTWARFELGIQLNNPRVIASAVRDILLLGQDVTPAQFVQVGWDMGIRAQHALFLADLPAPSASYFANSRHAVLSRSVV